MYTNTIHSTITLNNKNILEEGYFVNVVVFWLINSGIIPKGISSQFKE